jgi:hypothetical protein
MESDKGTSSATLQSVQLWEEDPTTQAEVQEARAAYETGDYVTLDEYLSRQNRIGVVGSLQVV